MFSDHLCYLQIGDLSTYLSTHNSFLAHIQTYLQNPYPFANSISENSSTPDPTSPLSVCTHVPKPPPSHRHQHQLKTQDHLFLLNTPQSSNPIGSPSASRLFWKDQGLGVFEVEGVAASWASGTFNERDAVDTWSREV